MWRGDEKKRTVRNQTTWRKASFASVIESGTKAGFLDRKRNVYIQLATTSSADKENHLCHCASCKSKLNSESLGHLMQARALLSIGIETLSVLGWLTRLYNWNRGFQRINIEVGRSGPSPEVRLKVEYWICIAKETNEPIGLRSGGRARRESERGRKALSSLNF